MRQCDEGKPKCIACTRHNVPCEYVEPAPRRSDVHHQHALATQNASADPYAVGSSNADIYGLDARLEIQLMNHWTHATSSTFSPDAKFWREDVILLASDNRMLLDAMFALTALHLSRQQPKQWISSIDRATSSRELAGVEPNAANGHRNGEKSPDRSVQTIDDLEYNSRYSRDMLQHARRYFDRSITGHTTGIHNLNKDNLDAVYHTSILLSLVAIFALGEADDDPTLLRVDPLFWTRLAEGIRYTCETRRQMLGGDASADAHLTFGNDRLQAAEELFQHEQGKPFEALLTFGIDHEPPAPEDRLVYQQTVAYLALIHKSVTEAGDNPLLDCWRLAAMASQLPRRFGEMVEYKAPRALTILAYVFAVMKLAAKDVPWFRGIAERQVPLLDQSVPPAWKELLKWPLEIAVGSSAQAAKPEVVSNSDDPVFQLLTRDPASS